MWKKLWKKIWKLGAGTIIKSLGFPPLVTALIDTNSIVSKDNKYPLRKDIESNKKEKPPSGITTYILPKFNITFHGNVTHYALKIHNFVIWGSWATNDPIDITINEYLGLRRPVKLSFNQNIIITAWFFFGENEIPQGIQQPGGNVSGYAFRLKINR